MNTITVTYTLKYQLKFSPNYQWTKDGKCFNIKTGRQLKQVYSNGSIGYCINGDFKSLSYLRKYLEKIKENYCPF